MRERYSSDPCEPFACCTFLAFVRQSVPNELRIRDDAITQSALNKIRPGVTTTADFVQLFGPDAKWSAYQGKNGGLVRSLGPSPAGYLFFAGEVDWEAGVVQTTTSLNPAHECSYSCRGRRPVFAQITSARPLDRSARRALPPHGFMASPPPRSLPI